MECFFWGGKSVFSMFEEVFIVNVCSFLFKDFVILSSQEMFCVEFLADVFCLKRCLRCFCYRSFFV